MSDDRGIALCNLLQSLTTTHTTLLIHIHAIRHVIITDKRYVSMFPSQQAFEKHFPLPPFNLIGHTRIPRVLAILKVFINLVKKIHINKYIGCL